jgi:hypothetical protein
MSSSHENILLLEVVSTQAKQIAAANRSDAAESGQDRRKLIAIRALAFGGNAK